MIYFISPQTRLFQTTDIQTSTIQALVTWAEGKSVIELDTETTGFDPHTCKILTIQFGDKDNQFVVDVSSLEKHYLPEAVREVLESDKLFLLQNAKFDLRFFMKCGVYIKNVYDTFLAECLLTAGLRETKEQKEKYKLGLDHLAEKYAGITLDKSIRGNIHKEGLTERVIKYAADDVKALGIIKEKQEVELARWGLTRVMELENKVVRVFARMEHEGVHLDQSKWLAVAEVTEQNTIALEQELDELVKLEPKLADYIPKYVQSSLFDTGAPSARPSIKWSSPKQKLDLLGLLIPNLTGTGDRDLQRVKKSHPIVPKLIDYAKQSKLATAFGREFLSYVNKATLRLHPNYWQILSTGRISSSEPNVNQIPSKGDLAKAIRAAFVAPQNKKIVGGDYSGMELRIIAELSQDPIWLDAFNTGKDLHSVLCSLTFGIDVSRVKEETPFKAGWSYRDVQKTINFGLAYGMSAHKLADTMQISLDDAQLIIDKFFAAVPVVSKFLESLGQFGRENLYIRSAKPYRRARFFEVDEEQNADFFSRRKRLGEIERASKNHPIQGTNADVIKSALIKVQQVIDDEQLDVKIILSVYDEIQTECHESIAEEWKDRLELLMKEAAEEIIKSVPVVVDCKVSTQWEK